MTSSLTRSRAGVLGAVLTVPLALAGAGAAERPAEAAAPQGSEIKTADDVLRHLTAHRRDTALVTYRVRADGRPAERGVRHRDRRPAPVASTVKILHLAAYATAAGQGRLKPSDRVRVKDWEAYYLPGTDGGAHPTALKRFGLAAGPDGRATDPEAAVTLDQIATAMIEHSDNAATDLLRARLGERALIAAAARAGGPVPAAVPSFAGQMLLAFGACGVKEFGGEEGVKRLAALPRPQRRARAERCVREYSAPGADRDRLTPQTLPELPVQSAWAETTEPVAPATLAALMGRIATGRYVSGAVSGLAQRHLEWATREGPLNERIVRIGTKAGLLPGVLGEATYTVDKARTVRVTVISFRRMAADAWLSAAQSYAHEQFIVKLADTPAYPEQVRAALG